MNKDEFIMKIIARHSPNMTPNQIPLATEDYTNSLEENIDFDLLFQTYLEEYNFNTAPKPAWFKQRAKKKIAHISSDFEIRSIYIKLPDGRKYEFAYEYPAETEYMAKIAIMDRFKDSIRQAKENGKEYNVEFISREEYRGC